MIGYDIDDVLAKFWPGFYIWFNREHPENWPTHWIDPFVTKNFYKIVNEKEFWLSLDVLNPPESLTVEPDFYCTARCVESELTREWLLKHGFPDKPVITVGTGQSKLQALKDIGCTAFIDDKPATYEELEAGGLNIIFYKPFYATKSYNYSKQITNISEYKNYV